jgi:hypothetical protein
MSNETEIIRNIDGLLSGKLRQGREKDIKMTLEAVGYEPGSAGQGSRVVTHSRGRGRGRSHYVE